MKLKTGNRFRVVVPMVCIFIISLFTFSILKPAKPVKVLLVTGGCCHNYDLQTAVIKTALPASLKAEWTVVNEGGTGTTALLGLYDDKNWAKSYDLIIHNECFADTKDSVYIKKITHAHQQGANAVVIHCAMHSYRAASINDWRQFLGVTTRRHDHLSQYPVKVVSPGHEITKGFPAQWTSAKDELYIIEKTEPSTTILLTSVSERDGKTHPVAWTNRYGKARVFGTTFGHSDETFKDTLFVKLLRQGMMWAMDKK